MSSSLFRQEAIEHQKDRLMGEVLLLQPISLIVLTAVALVVALFIAALLTWGTYARREMVRGYLVPDTGIVKIYASSPGTVSKLCIKEGDHVGAGASLLTILAERTLEAGEDVSLLQMDELQQSIFQKQKQIEGAKAFYNLELDRLDAQIDSSIVELKETDKAIDIQAERLALAAQRVKALESLKAKGHVSETDYQKVLEELLTQKQHQQELYRNQAAKKMSIEQAKKERAQFPLRHDEKLSELENQIAELNRQKMDVEGRRVYEIRSPIAGKVTSLQARFGQMQSHTTHLMSIIPDNAVLEAELFVPTRAIGFIEENQAVRLRYDAFPYQRFGIYEGHVKSISKNILHPSELQVPFELQEPVYKVIVALDSQQVKAYGQALPLQAGILLEADIILDKRSLFEWVLEPLYSLRGRF
ncbi:MAG: HlyD family efflux transporter periplasmic adaptor subunit [Gammaproteobacteria bacterium]